jgi:hypothetical protein
MFPFYFITRQRRPDCGDAGKRTQSYRREKRRRITLLNRQPGG